MTEPTMLIPVTFTAPQEPQPQVNQPTGEAPRTGAAPGQATGTQQQPGPQPGGGGQPQQQCGTETFLMMGVFLVLMWMLIMRPEQKRRKETQAMLAAIKVGDRVVTAGGMHAVIHSLQDKTVTLRVDTIKVTVDRTAIARVERGEPAAGSS